MCITKYVCPRCFDPREEYSHTCPPSPHPITPVEDKLFGNTNPSEPCAQVSEVCVWCELDDEEVKTDNVGLETMLWRRRLKEFKQRRKGETVWRKR
jgi:hypothetical protein